MLNLQLHTYLYIVKRIRKGRLKGRFELCKEMEAVQYIQTLTSVIDILVEIFSKIGR